jgi:hypothetical protein
LYDKLPTNERLPSSPNNSVRSCRFVTICLHDMNSIGVQLIYGSIHSNIYLSLYSMM